MNRKPLVILISLLAFVLVSYLLTLNEPIKSGACTVVGGKFSASTKECIYKNCAKTSSCQPSYANSSVCKKLKPNISKDELYFELGMPLRNEGNEYYFHGNAGENTQVKATVLNGKVEILECEI